ncbi:MAG: DNA gyrase inhibitor YacG [Acidobacteria bacterium]|nr:DNA gyrase inhibitor YacG [Acidobacteriota bacterium]
MKLTACRICGSPTSPANPDYPFCGDRCRERDLGNWASELYRVAVPITAEDDIPDRADPDLSKDET